MGTLKSWLEVLSKGQTLPWGPPARQPQAALDRAGGRGEGGWRVVLSWEQTETG